MKIVKITILVVLLTFSLSLVAGFKLIKTEELKKKVDSKEKLVIIDALPGPLHKMGYISGAISIPDGLFSKMSDKLPKDKSTLLVFYCLGPKCVLSKNSAKKAIKLGYKNVMVYNEGLPAWRKRGYKVEVEQKLEKVKIPYITPEQFKNAQDKYFVVDIMYENNFKKGYIKGSIHIILDDVESNLSKFPKDKPILIIDHSNKLDKIACWILHSKGYKNLFRLKGGKMGWMMKGFPLEKK